MSLRLFHQMYVSICFFFLLIYSMRISLYYAHEVSEIMHKSKNRNLREYDLRVINSWENLPFLTYWISVVLLVLLLIATFRFAHKINFANSETLFDRSESTDRNARYLWLVRIKRISKKNRKLKEKRKQKKKEKEKEHKWKKKGGNWKKKNQKKTKKIIIKTKKENKKKKRPPRDTHRDDSKKWFLKRNVSRNRAVIEVKKTSKSWFLKVALRPSDVLLVNLINHQISILPFLTTAHPFCVCHSDTPLLHVLYNLSCIACDIYHDVVKIDLRSIYDL